jgi:hypothetical protein
VIERFLNTDNGARGNSAGSLTIATPDIVETAKATHFYFSLLQQIRRSELTIINPLSKIFL